jgi:hypothetical protein
MVLFRAEASLIFSSFFRDYGHKMLARKSTTAFGQFVTEWIFEVMGRMGK